MFQEVASGGAVFGCPRRWEMAGATHTATPGLCPPETSHVGVDAGGKEYIFVLNRSQNGNSRSGPEEVRHEQDSI